MPGVCRILAQLLTTCFVFALFSFILPSASAAKYQQPGRPILLGVASQPPQATPTGAAPPAIQLTDETDNQVAIATAKLSVTATTTKWALDTDPPLIVNALGEGWGQTSKVLSCLNGINGGVTQLTLPYAPNGTFDLWLKVYQEPLYLNDAHARFNLDGKKYNFVPTEKLGYQWVRIKAVQITNNSYTFSIDDRVDGGIRLQTVKLEEVQSTGKPLVVEAAPVIGSIPLPVQFLTVVDSPESLSFLWAFGDGAISTLLSPSYTYQSIGTYTSSVTTLNTSGNVRTGSVLINAEPGPNNLVGLQDIEAFGFYSAGFRANSDGDLDTYLFNQRRMDELQNLNIRAVYVEFWSFWYDTPEKRVGYHQFLDDLHAHGIQAIVKVTTITDWFTNDASELTKEQWIFDMAEAKAKFQFTDVDGNSVSDLDGRIDVLYLEHEILEYATYAERVQMYQLARRYFPNTPILNNYGGIFAAPFLRVGQAHSAGGFWEDYQFGPGEVDIIHMGSGRPFFNDEPVADRVYAIQNTLDNIRLQKQYADAIAPELPIWVNVNFAKDETMDADPNSMWKPEEILGWAKVILSFGDIQGLFMRSYGRFTYELGFGLNTEDPSIPETGFIEQRQAVKTIGEWILNGVAN